MNNHIDGEQPLIHEAAASHDLGALLLMASAARAMGEIQSLAIDELRLLAAYRKNEESRRLLQTVVKMINSLPDSHHEDGVISDAHRRLPPAT